MIPRLASLRPFLPGLLLAASVVLPASAQEGLRPDLVCLSSSEVDALVRERRVRPLTELTRGVAGEIVRARLCRGEERYVYRLVLFDARGGVRAARVDAQSGRLVYDGR